MKNRYLKSDLLFLTTATIWGFAFVAQRMGMDHVGPFTFNGIRFFLGAMVLLPFIHGRSKRNHEKKALRRKENIHGLAIFGTIAGLAIFAGASLQQVGLVYTTAGKAGFITGLYVIIVPIMGLCWGQRTNAGTWIGALLATVGMYLLSITEDVSISMGDLLELIGAVFWAGHIHLIGWVSPKTDALKLAFAQYVVCAAASLATAFVFETITLPGIINAAIPILYGGVLSVGIAYTLQVVAQRHAHPAHAAILLSLESVFAALGGWLILDEMMSGRGMAGCCLMFSGMLVSQLYGFIRMGHGKKE